MMIHEVANNILTIISIITTIISILCFISSRQSAKTVKDYMQKAVLLKDTIDLKAFAYKFNYASTVFQNRTLARDWYRGLDVTHVISPFLEVLKSFSTVYGQFGENTQSVKSKVHALYELVRQYDRASGGERKECSSLILDLSDILNQQVCNSTNLIVQQKL